jgi:spore coat protein U-like protein
MSPHARPRPVEPAHPAATGRPRSGPVVRAMLAAAGLACTLLGPATALAQPARCNVQTQSVAFGSYDVFRTAPNDSVGAVLVSCGGPQGMPVAYEIRLSGGLSGMAASRTMRSGDGWSLAYNLYADPARTVVWGDGSGGTRGLADGYLLIGPSITRRYPVYGRQFPRQNVAPGTYTDTLVVTVEY